MHGAGFFILQHPFSTATVSAVLRFRRRNYRVGDKYVEKNNSFEQRRPFGATQNAIILLIPI